jgi:hypothetical protein
MKKLFLSFAVIAGMSMISCGNKAADETVAEEVDSTEVVEEAPVDSVVVADTVSAPADSAAVAE